MLAKLDEKYNKITKNLHPLLTFYINYATIERLSILYSLLRPLAFVFRS